MTFRHGKLGKSDVFFLIFAATFFAVFLSTQFAGVESKAMAYMGDRLHIAELAQIIVIFFAGLFLLSNRTLYALTMLPLFLSVLLLGDIRVNMIVFVVFLYLLLKENRGNHIFMYLLACYFFIKSIPFVQNIFECGNGYYGI